MSRPRCPCRKQPHAVPCPVPSPSAEPRALSCHPAAEPFQGPISGPPCPGGPCALPAPRCTARLWPCRDRSSGLAPREAAAAPGLPRPAGFQPGTARARSAGLTERRPELPIRLSRARLRCGGGSSAGRTSCNAILPCPAPLGAASSPSTIGERLEPGRNPHPSLSDPRARLESAWSLAGTPAPRSARNTCTGLCQLPEEDERVAEGLEEHPHPPRPPKPAQDCGSRALTRCAARRGCPPDTSGGSASPAAARPCNRSLQDAFCCREDPSPAGEGAGGGCAC